MKTTTDEMVRTADKLIVLRWRMLEANKCACGNIFATPYYLRKHDEALKELNEIRDALTADGYDVLIDNGPIISEGNDELEYGYEITVTISRAGDGEDQAVVRTLSGYMKEGSGEE